MERGTASRDLAQRLGRHLAECPDCRARADGVRDVAASLERLAGHTRADLSADAAESLFRRARVHGLLGRPLKMPLVVRAGLTRWTRLTLPIAMAAAAVALVAVGIWMALPGRLQPRGALERLVRAGHGIRTVEDLRPLARLARAAVSEELARPQPAPEQVADLLLVAYIAERPREDRQTADMDFLLGGLWQRAGGLAVAHRPWPMLASVVLADTAGAAGRTLLGDYRERPLAAAKEKILAGQYEAALELLPTDGSGAVLKAWCLAWLGRRAEAALTLAEAKDRADGDVARLIRADLALGARDVAEAMQQYETLAADHDRYWFTAGYLYRYELRDARGAGERFQRVQEPRLARYVAQTFATELALAREPEPEPLVAIDFGDYDLGALPGNWMLVRVRDGEFEVVDAGADRALSQGDGTEFACGEPEWADYTVQADVKVVLSKGDFTVGASAYRRADRTGYVLQLTPQSLRIVKQFPSEAEDTAPLVAREHQLVLPPAEGWWYTLKIRVQRVDDGVSVAGKVWRSDVPEPLGWHVVWTDTGQAQAGPLAGGRAGVRVRGAQVLVDNFVITRNVSSSELVVAAP